MLNILFVDDDEDDRQLFSEAVKYVTPEINLTLVTCGDELIKLLETSAVTPDLIFLDLNMPGLSGIKCLELIKSDERYKHIPIAIYSTSWIEKQIDETYEKGANLYLRKLSSFQDMQKQIGDVLQMKKDQYMPQSPRDRFLVA